MTVKSYFETSDFQFGFTTRCYDLRVAIHFFQMHSFLCSPTLFSCGAIIRSDLSLKTCPSMLKPFSSMTPSSRAPTLLQPLLLWQRVSRLDLLDRKSQSRIAQYSVGTLCLAPEWRVPREAVAGVSLHEVIFKEYKHRKDSYVMLCQSMQVCRFKKPQPCAALPLNSLTRRYT